MAGHHDAHFGPSEWMSSAALAVVWGSSFLWIAIAIDYVDVAVVPFLRCGFGAAVLALLPGARQLIARSEWPRMALLAALWMAIPFMLYPIAERTVSSSITGMMNGGLPVVTAIVTAFYTRHRPTWFRMLAVLIGSAGIALISLGSIGDGVSADGRGIALLVLALLCYALAANIARPVQHRYGSLPTMLWMTVGATAMSAPLGLVGLAHRGLGWKPLGALLMLGAVGTGLAFAIYGWLLLRAGTVRGMIGIFFTPIVGTVLGVMFRDDRLSVVSVLGMVVVIVGAVMVSRPEPA